MGMSLDKSCVKLADFGSATYVEERVRTDYLQPRYYRSPEIILGQPYNMQIDQWSAGATIYEIATGKFLFVAQSNNHMLHEHLKAIGPFPKAFATTGDVAPKHFTMDGDFKLHTSVGGENGEMTEEIKPMDRFPKPPSPLFLKQLQEHAGSPPAGGDFTRHKARLHRLADLIARCVVSDPAARATCDQCLEHKFFQSFASALGVPPSTLGDNGVASASPAEKVPPALPAEDVEVVEVVAGDGAALVSSSPETAASNAKSPAIAPSRLTRPV